MHCFKVQGKALRQRSVSKFKDARVSIERYCQRCEGESSFGIQNVQCALFITTVVSSSKLQKKMYTPITQVAGAWTERKKMFLGGSFLKLADDDV